MAEEATVPDAAPEPTSATAAPAPLSPAQGLRKMADLLRIAAEQIDKTVTPKLYVVAIPEEGKPRIHQLESESELLPKLCEIRNDVAFVYVFVGDIWKTVLRGDDLYVSPPNRDALLVPKTSPDAPADESGAVRRVCPSALADTENDDEVSEEQTGEEYQRPGAPPVRPRAGGSVAANVGDPDLV